MAFVATDSTSEPRAFSIGTQKIQILTWTCISGDTTASITCDRLSSVSQILIDGGLILNAAPTFATNVITLAFNDPVASLFGTMIAIGR